MKPQGVKVGGVTIKRVSGHNAKFIIENGLGPDAIIRVTRSGDVIPYIVEVTKRVKPQLPSKTLGKYTWDSNKTDFVLVKSSGGRLPPNKEADRVQSIKNMVHFFSTLGVDALKLGNVTKLYDYHNATKTILGIIDSSIYTLADAFGSMLIAKKVHASLVKALKSATHERMMDASGVFGRGIGTRRATAILRKISFASLSRMSESTMVNKITLLDGFSDKIATQFTNGFSVYKQFIEKLEGLGYTVKEVAKKKITSHNLDGQVITPTGFRDKDLGILIERNGGVYSETFSAKTTILLVKSLDIQSSKIDKAKAKGLNIFTKDQFIKRYKL